LIFLFCFLLDIAVPITRTKYEEDIFVNNHTSVWGSYYSRARESWGYRCCHSLLRNSYCTGEVGRAANDDAAFGQAVDPHQARKLLASKAQQKAADEKSGGSSNALVSGRMDIFGESSSNAARLIDETRLKEAQRRAVEWQSRDHAADADDRKRNYNSMTTINVTIEDMEAYRLKKTKGEDPMAKFVDSEELLER
jgi:pre-mRNA-processing factor SLU7